MKVTILTVGTRGDVQPCLAFGQALQTQGHEVNMAAPLDYEKMVDESGLRFFPIRQQLRDIYRQKTGSQCLTERINPLHFLFGRNKKVRPILDCIVSDLVSACTGSDIILYTILAMPASFIANDLGLPSMALCFQPLSRTQTFPSIFFHPQVNIRFLNIASHFLAEKAIRLVFQGSITRWRKKSRIPKTTRQHIHKYSHREYPVLNAFSAHIVPKPSDWGKRKHITGFWFLDSAISSCKPSGELIKFLENGEPPVCISFGSMNDIRVKKRVNMGLQALQKTGKRAVLIAGKSGLQKQDLIISDNILVVDEVSHKWLFPRVSAIIHHGGAGTVAAAIRAGIASIIIPFFFDQKFWGNRLFALGVGPQPIHEKKLSVETIAKAITAVVEERKYNLKLQNLSVKVNNEKGLECAVKAFELETSRSITQKRETKSKDGTTKFRKFSRANS
ncbi:MAG: glycosyltransferase [Leptospirales bacterium]